MLAECNVLCATTLYVYQFRCKLVHGYFAQLAECSKCFTTYKNTQNQGTIKVLIKQIRSSFCFFVLLVCVLYGLYGLYGLDGFDGLYSDSWILLLEVAVHKLEVKVRPGSVLVC